MKISLTNGFYQVYEFEETHNHILATGTMAQYLRSHRKVIDSIVTWKYNLDATEPKNAGRIPTIQYTNGISIRHCQVFLSLWNFCTTELCYISAHRAIQKITYALNSNCTTQLCSNRALEPLPLLWWQSRIKSSSMNRSQVNKFAMNDL